MRDGEMTRYWISQMPKSKGQTEYNILMQDDEGRVSCIESTRNAAEALKKLDRWKAKEAKARTS
jgi:hypothetical protein